MVVLMVFDVGEVYLPDIRKDKTNHFKIFSNKLFLIMF